ncbi:peptidoglycan-binding protein [Streptomyces sp. NPDC057376]|uniref:peptidoglycan-binding domain-containing protein n=1 Tax=unclassified Streptomyces TaxID=2593676 RepID=UPI00093A6B12|nr:hypothetical protein [Streptomyces sp. CB02414]OKI74979.1 hypothetical protein AMK11_34655 [Streptomyces sp. CB02414]
MQAMTRALATVATVVAIAAGSLAVAGTSVAATSEKKPVASAETSAPLAVVNLGLTTSEAKSLQGKFLRAWGYTGAMDGIAGPETRAAFRRMANVT